MPPDTCPTAADYLKRAMDKDFFEGGRFDRAGWDAFFGENMHPEVITRHPEVVEAAWLLYLEAYPRGSRRKMRNAT